jgi:homoserine kinase
MRGLGSGAASFLGGILHLFSYYNEKLQENKN